MKEFMDKLFDQMEARSEPKEGEYLAEDGLLYDRVDNVDARAVIVEE